MKIAKRIVYIDIERAKNANTGLHSFCMSLYDSFKNIEIFNFIFFIPKNEKLVIKNIFPTKWYHKFFLPIQPNSIWHCTHQLSKFFPTSKKIKTVYTIHDLNFLYTDKPDWKKKKLLQKIQNRINKSDWITFISKFTKEEVEKHLNLTHKKNSIIHNGVTLKRFENCTSPQIKPSTKFLYNLGVIAPKKNLHVLLPFLAKTDYQLVLSGQVFDKSYYNYLLDEIKKLNLEDRVHLTGPVTDEDKFWYLSNCDGFIFPSISEGFGIPPIEAMKLGKPVFLSNKTSLPEIGGNVAYYFEDFSPETIYKTFQEGMYDYDTHNRKKEIINWANQFTWEKASEKYLEIYKQIF